MNNYGNIIYFFLAGLIGGFSKKLLDSIKNIGSNKTGLQKLLFPTKLILLSGIIGISSIIIKKTTILVSFLVGYVVTDIIYIIKNTQIKKAKTKTHTFIVRRYFPAKLLIKMIYGNQPISILDIGCSLNLGLQAISADERGEIFIGTKVNMIPSNLYRGKVKINYGLGIDISEIKLKDVLSGVHPEEGSEIDIIDKTYANLNNKDSKIYFRKMNATTLYNHPELAGKFDVIIATGVLYQLSSEDKKEFLKGVSYVSKPLSWLITSQYYRKTGNKTLLPYITLINKIKNGKIQDQLEFLRTDSPFSRVIKKGQDFKYFLKYYPPAKNTNKHKANYQRLHSS